MLPRVGPGAKPGVFYNTGHGHLGWTLSAVTAETVAESVALNLPPGASQAPSMAPPAPRQAGPHQAGPHQDGPRQAAE
jgi:glycine/D-amino acid oxidase-like deaminating enzyme